MGHHDKQQGTKAGSLMYTDSDLEFSSVTFIFIYFLKIFFFYILLYPLLL